jgi:hypothetical protein
MRVSHWEARGSRGPRREGTGLGEQREVFLFLCFSLPLEGEGPNAGP